MAESGLRLGSLPWAVPVQLLPQCLGVGHSAGPVDVQIPAAGGERESQCEHVGRHRAGLCPQNSSVEPCCPSTL